ncbi:hypothetical protein H4R27_002407 [Coemansia aciculifera]|nr:hypothetical protein GGI19_004179 [Coemansia pectinata]KAJ2883982.1 hypothetical protein H4R27_002407 [Coemansia aciculifera]
MVRFGTNTQKSTEPAWQDVGANVLRMDSLYDASFHEWLKNEGNVSIIASYLQRIANEYPMDRIINALRWLVSSWRVESTAVIVRHITADWAVPQAPPPKPAASAHFRLDPVPVPPPSAADPSMLSGEARRGVLVRELTKDWTCQQIAQLVGMLALTFWSERTYLEAFLRTLVSDWDFCRLSSFFSYISGQLGLDYRVKVTMLQDAARRNATRLSLKRARNGAAKLAGIVGDSAGECDGNDSKRARIAPSPSVSSSASSSFLARSNGADATAASSQQLPSALHSSGQSATIANINTSATTPLASSSSNPTSAAAAPTAAAASAIAGGGAPMPLSARAAQSGRMPAPLQTGRPTLQFASQTQPATGAVTTPSSPSSPALIGGPSPQLASVEPLASEEMQLSSSTTDLASMPYAESTQQQLQRRRSRNNTSGSAMGAPPSSTVSAMSGETRGEQVSSSAIIARRPLTPQMSSSVFTVHAAARPSSPTLRRHHRHNLSCQHRDCPPQPLTPSHSSSSLSIMATASNADSASSASASGSLTMRPSICLAPTSESSAQSPGDASLAHQQQQAVQQQQQDFRSRTGSEGDLGQFDGPASTRLALPLPSESSANAANMCGRTSAAPYDVLGIVMAEPEHHLAGSSA